VKTFYIEVYGENLVSDPKKGNGCTTLIINILLAAFSRENSFVTVIKFLNMIGLALSSSLDLNV